MRTFITPLLVSLLLISARSLPAANQTNKEESKILLRSSNKVHTHVTGRLVQTHRGYSLKTDTDAYRIETEKDLSHFVNKQIKVTGILERQNATAPSWANGDARAIAEIRLRMNIKVSNASSLRLNLVGSGGKPVWQQQLRSGLYVFAGNDRVVVLVGFAFQRSISRPAACMDYLSQVLGG